MHHSMDREKFDIFARIFARPVCLMALLVGVMGTAACAPVGTAVIKSAGAPGIEDGQGSGDVGGPGATPAPTPPPQGSTPAPTPPPVSSSKVVPDQDIALSAAADAFAKSIATRLANSRYMEKNCVDVATWNEWVDLPMKRCRYSSSGQTAEVLMLNPGPRRLAMWLEDACAAFSSSVSTCMTSTFNHIMGQSGAQFPVAGIVIEDMDGNGKGNLYCFRNGVTVQIPSFGTATESKATETWIANSFTDKPSKTYSYARPVSATRSQLNSYAQAQGFLGDEIPMLSTSASSGAASNLFNEVTGDLYREAWYSKQNHVIRAWVHSNF
jgi:hypothetical protein